MPAGSTSFAAFSELVSTTLPLMSKGISDNVSRHNALYRKLTENGRVDLVGGGHSIRETLDYQQNSTYTRYSGYDTLNISAVDVISSAEYPWKQASISIASSGFEINANSGPEQIINLAKAKIINARRSAANNQAVDIYSDGSLTDQITGIQAQIADTPTNTVGGISGATFPFWQNVVQSAAAPLQGGASITPSATTIESLWSVLYYRLTRGMDQPQLIIASQDYFSFYEASQVSYKNYADQKTAQGGFVNLKYKNAEVIFEGDAIIPSSHAYFINLDALKWVVHKNANWTQTEPRLATTQDAQAVFLLFMGNLVCNNRSLQGVQKA